MKTLTTLRTLVTLAALMTLAILTTLVALAKRGLETLAGLNVHSGICRKQCEVHRRKFYKLAGAHL